MTQTRVNIHVKQEDGRMNLKITNEEAKERALALMQKGFH
jgi:hypothetical protein